MRWGSVLVQSWADLVLGAQCAGCDQPGPAACPTCTGALHLGPLWRQVGSLPVVAATSYRPPVPALVKGFKDSGNWGLAGPLASALLGVLPLVLEPGSVLVPLPSPRSRVRERGLDHTLTLARRVGSRQVPVRQFLHRPRPGADQQGLDRQERWDNQRARFRARPGGASVVLVDDVVTTGATLLAASAALSAAGHRVVAAVTVASSELLTQERRARPDPKG